MKVVRRVLLLEALHKEILSFNKKVNTAKHGGQFYSIDSPTPTS